MAWCGRERSPRPRRPLAADPREHPRPPAVAPFAEWVAERRGLDFGDPVDYDALWRWSVEHLDQFWADVADWTDVLPGVPDDGC